MPNVKDISIVIIGKNAEWSIAKLLDSVLTHTPPMVTSELIYVDSASTDRTLQIVSRYPVKIVSLRPDERLCASAGRFVGSQHATGTYIVFIDSDMELLEGWLERAVRLLESHSEIAAVSGIQLDTESSARPAEETTDYARYSEDGVTEIKFAGSAAMFRRDALERAGTWNPTIVSDEEPELCLRVRHAGYRIVRLERPSVRHFGYMPSTISALLSRRRRRLFLGYGQVIRCHLSSGLLVTYLRERGWVVTPALAVLAGMIALLVSWLTGNVYWVVSFFCILLLGFAADALRSRSVYKATYHVLHRALILEGTIRGFVRRPYAQNEYQHDSRRTSTDSGPIDPVVPA